MSEITPEKTHALLEKLAEYVMTELPTRKEVDKKLASMETRFITQMRAELENKADKADLDHLDNKVNLLLEGMDAQAKQLEELNLDMKTVVSRTLDNHEERLADLEVHNFGVRVRDDEEKYKNKGPKV